MKTTPLSNGSLQFTRLGLVNCYLVREEDGFTLVDTNIPGSAEGIIAAAAKAGAPIRRILLTHAHQDHMGSVDELIAKLGPIEVAASRRSLPLLRRKPDRSFEPGEPKGRVVGTPGMATAITRVLAEGDLCGSLRVIETPGHIPGHLSFLDERDGTLYAGDAVVGFGGLLIPGNGPWWFPLIDLFSWNKEIALESARKLCRYPIARFATGHLAVRDGGVTRLQELVAKADRSARRNSDAGAI